MSKEIAKRYEVAWNQLFYMCPDWRQEIIIDEPHGRHAGELAGLAARLAEDGKLCGHEKYNSYGEVEFKTPPTGVSSI